MTEQQPQTKAALIQQLKDAFTKADPKTQARVLHFCSLPPGERQKLVQACADA